MSAVEIEMVEKACSTCGEVKPLSGFYRDRNRRDGRTSRCRSCHRASSDAAAERRRAEDPEAFLRRGREIVQQHRARTGNARGKALMSARTEAVRLLIAAHRAQFKAIFWQVKAERGLLLERDLRPRDVD